MPPVCQPEPGAGAKVSEGPKREQCGESGVGSTVPWPLCPISLQRETNQHTPDVSGLGGWPRAEMELPIACCGRTHLLSDMGV